MRIVVSAKKHDGTRDVVVYDNRAQNRVAEIEVEENERAELRVVPVQKAEVDSEVPPRDAAEIWAEVELDEYRVIGRQDEQPFADGGEK